MLLLWAIGCEGAPPEPVVLPEVAFVGSSACLDCHTEQAGQWRGSHHALAQRDLQSAERLALSAHPEARIDGDSVVLAGHEVVGVLGVEPLWQPLLAADGGRIQVLDEGWDVAAGQWFSVFESPREAGEWGHWSGRGMTWNTMCGECHTTGFSKNHQPITDTYTTTFAEAGVGCEGCHGPSSQHAVDAAVSTPTPRPAMTDCAPCHSRRATLSTRSGGHLLDQYALQTLSSDTLFHPDGQIRDEVFEYASFLSSRMHQEGVTCADCHDAHSGELLREGDDLCLSCHETHTAWQAHDHHPGGEAGCVDCHMPQTTYMQRPPPPGSWLHRARPRPQPRSRGARRLQPVS